MIYKVKISAAICAAMSLDDPNLRKEMGFEPDSFKNLKSGMSFTGSIDEIERLADCMQRGPGWDLPAPTLAACNKRAAQLLTFVRETRAGKDLPE